MNKRHIFLILVFCAIAVNVLAVKVDPRPTTIVQSDGSRLTVVGRGNCEVHWYTTLDGVLLYHEGNDFYIAELTASGQLLPTPQLAHEPGQRTVDEKTVIAHQQRMAARFSSPPMLSPRHEPLKDNSTYFPHVGSPRVLVILAQFQDVMFIDEDPIPVFEQYLNAEEIDKKIGNRTVSLNYGSVMRYFEDMSDGAFTPQFDIYGPVTLSHELKYYGEGSNDQMSLFVPETCQLADEAGVDFSQYDANNDGLVDLVYIIYAGYSESITGNSSDCIWPKSGTLSGGVYDGVGVYRFGVHSELNGYPDDSWEKKNGMKRINGIGLFCHEFSHCMGLPDIYPTNSRAQDAGNPSMEYWDVMDGGEYTQNGYYPTEYTAWERETMGWMQMDTLTVDGNYELAPLGTENKNAKAFRIMNENDPSGHEYVFLQNVQPVGFNQRIGQVLGHGLLITHVDYDKIAFSLESNSVNNNVGHSRMTIVPADDEYISYYMVDDSSESQSQYILSHKGDPFPGSTGRTEISSFPFYTGTSPKSLLAISEDATTGLISFTFNATESAIRSVMDVPADTRREVYDISGRRVINPIRKGVYIIGGRKVVM